MKTAQLIYRPVMDYEESETAYLICRTKSRAEKVRSEMVEYAKKLLSDLESLYDEEGEMIPDDEYFEREKRNDAKIEAAIWPYKINLRYDIPWRQFNSSFDESCIAIQELELV